MSKKKAKSRQNENNRKKLEAAKHRQDFIKRLRDICNLIHPDLYGTLTPLQIDAIYWLRGAALKVMSEEGNISKEALHFANEYARIMQKNVMIKLTRTGHSVTLGDYNYIVSPLEWMIRPDAPFEHDVRPNPDLWQSFPWYNSFMKERERRFSDYMRNMRELQLPISLFISDLRHMLYSAKYTEEGHKPKPGHHDDGRISHYIYFRQHRPEKKRIRLPNGEVRLAVRLTIVIPLGIEWPEVFSINLPPSDFGKKGVNAQKELPVYITAHALNRIEERLGCASQGFTQFEIFRNLFECRNKLRTIKPALGKLLVEYQLYDKKVGYLVISIPKNVILIHTFLLITSNSTPEGALLRKQLGFGKLDKAYLGIDKLQTFVHSDIFQYEDTRQLFINAGCESLIELSERLKTDILWMHEGETIKLASKMRDYLKTDSEEYIEPDSDLNLEEDDPIEEDDLADLNSDGTQQHPSEDNTADNDDTEASHRHHSPAYERIKRLIMEEALQK
jgi:hypothetical protein